MTDREVFVAQILEAPADDGPRAAFADWLQEQPEAGFQAWGRFASAGLIASRFRDRLTPIVEPEYLEAIGSLGRLVPALVPRLLGSLGLLARPEVPFRRGMAWSHVCDRIAVAHRGAGEKQQAVFTRGFLSELHLTLGEWHAAAAEVVGRCPLERVEIVDVPGLEFFVRRVPEPDGPGPAWELCAARSSPMGRRRSGPAAPGPERVWRPADGTRPALVAGLHHAIPDLVERLRHAAGECEADPVGV